MDGLGRVVGDRRRQVRIAHHPLETIGQRPVELPDGLPGVVVVLVAVRADVVVGDEPAGLGQEVGEGPEDPVDEPDVVRRRDVHDQVERAVGEHDGVHVHLVVVEREALGGRLGACLVEQHVEHVDPHRLAHHTLAQELALDPSVAGD